MENEFEENKAFLMEGIVSRVRFGFSDPETMINEVLEQVEDEGWEDDFEEGWVRETITGLYNQRLAESKTWQHPTDTERLVLVFERMRKEKIVALHFAGYTQSDSIADVSELYAQLRADNKHPEGHCFYHEQDLERVIPDKGGDLLLGFYGADSKDTARALKVARTIIHILQQQGFETDWKQGLAQRITIKNFKWLKVYTNDEELEIWDHTKVLDTF
jgi:hypothetical protein